ncbi:MAG: FtsW/RodA/SpoVE family cell cycle protein [Patescibacteria group bacterium]
MSRAGIKNESRFFLILVVILSLFGFFIFLSASLGMIGSDMSGFIHVGLKQFIVLLVGLVAMVLVSNIPYRYWRVYSLPLLILSIIATALVFIPGLGISAGGATRWLGFGGISIQPAELLKLGIIMYYAAWLATAKQKASTISYGLIPMFILMAVSGFLLILQPDTGTFLVIASALICQFFVGGGKWRHLLIVALCGILALGLLVVVKPYLRDRITTFLDPDSDTQGSAYQINQSLIAIGSGGFSGRGFGQSLQKFNFLPQPIGDSIFAVAGEEFGFIGTIIILLLFLSFGLFGLKIASGSGDIFGRLLATGLVILIISQSLANIGAMLGLIPLTGEPLIFVSQGGSALLFGLTAVGIIMNIARHKRQLSE